MRRSGRRSAGQPPTRLRAGGKLSSAYPAWTVDGPEVTESAGGIGTGSVDAAERTPVLRTLFTARHSVRMSLSVGERESRALPTSPSSAVITRAPRDTVARIPA